MAANHNAYKQRSVTAPSEDRNTQQEITNFVQGWQPSATAPSEDRNTHVRTVIRDDYPAALGHRAERGSQLVTVVGKPFDQPEAALGHRAERGSQRQRRPRPRG